MDKVDTFATFSQEENRSAIPNNQAVSQFKKKFYGSVAVSSQLNQGKGLKTINIFESSKARNFSMPGSRQWKKKQPVPIPIFVNLEQINKKK